MQYITKSPNNDLAYKYLIQGTALIGVKEITDNAAEDNLEVPCTISPFNYRFLCPVISYYGNGDSAYGYGIFNMSGIPLSQYFTFFTRGWDKVEFWTINKIQTTKVTISHPANIYGRYVCIFAF